MAEDRVQKNIFGTGSIIAATIILAVLALTCLLLLNVLYPRDLGLQQPIPFSHRVHVTVKHLNCFFCHTQATTSAHAGIPPLETCLLCHERIIRTYPYIVKLRRHYENREPIQWERINWVPEFVFFNHSMHIRKGIDCGMCHGNIALMDRVKPAHEFQMGFCIGCHRENHATHDCMGCHR